MKINRKRFEYYKFKSDCPFKKRNERKFIVQFSPCTKKRDFVNLFLGNDDAPWDTGQTKV